MSEPLMPEREAEIRETQLGEWYDGPWTQGYVEGSGDDPAYYRVKHAESGTTLATLPDWAGPIALFIADAHDAVPELLAELDRVRAERDQYATQLDGLHLTDWENQQEYRSKVLNEAIEAARSEHLHKDTGTAEDEAYNQGVTDAAAAIDALTEGGEPQTTARGLTPKEAMLRLMSDTVTDPERAAAFAKAADEEREAAIADRQSGGA